MFVLRKLSLCVIATIFACGVLFGIKSALAAGDIQIDVNALETNNPSPALSGNISDTSALVAITVNGVTIEATVDPNGTWSIPDGYIPDLPPGTYDVQAYAENSNTGLWGSDDTTDELTVIDNTTEDPELIFPEITEDNVSLINVTGSAEANSMVNISVNDGYHDPVEQTIFTDTEGNISDWMNFATLWDGTLKISYFAIDAYGNVSNTMEQEVVKNSATLEEPFVNVSSNINQNSADSVRVSGQGYSDSTIFYYFTDENGARISGEIITDGDGNFIQDVDLTSLQDGNIVLVIGQFSGFEQSPLQEINLKKDTVEPVLNGVSSDIINESNKNSYQVTGSTEPNGIIHYVFTQGEDNISGSVFADGSGEFTFTEDLSSFNDGEISLAITIVDRALNMGEANVITLIKSSEAPVRPEITSENGDITDEYVNDYHIAGTALPGILIKAIYTDGIVTHETETNTLEDGTFDLGFDFTNLRNGTITITILAINEFGNSSEPVEINLTKNTINLENPSVVFNGLINNDSAGHFVLSGQGLANGLIDYILTDENGNIVTGQIQIDSEGNFSQEIDLTSLSNGNITLTVRQLVDLDQSEFQTFELTKDASLPEFSEINSGSINSVNQNSYEVTGATEPNATVFYTFAQGDLTENGEVVADENGIFIINVDLSSFSDGNITFSIYAIDSASNTGEIRELELEKNTEKPATPEITYEGYEINDTNVSDYYLNGVGTPGTIIIATYSDGILTREISTEVLEDGTFQLEFDFSEFQNGTISILVVSADAFGNVSDQADGTLTKNTTISDPVDDPVTDNSDLSGLVSTASTTSTNDDPSTTLPQSGFSTLILMAIMAISFLAVKRLLKA